MNPTAFDLFWKGMVVIFLVIGILYGFIKLMNVMDAKKMKNRKGGDPDNKQE